MANSSTIKIATAALGGSGILVGGALGIYHHLNKATEENNKSTTEKPKSKGKPISEWLTGGSVTLLNGNEDDEAWKANWGQFIADYENNDLPDAWSIDKWSNKKTDKQVVPDDFKTNCDKNSKLTTEKAEGDNYVKVKKYCTKDTALKAPVVAK